VNSRPTAQFHALFSTSSFARHISSFFRRKNLSEVLDNKILIHARLADVKLYGNASEVQAAMYDRDNPRYPYKSHGQWLKACYGLVACILLVIFNGVGPFLEHPFDTRRFVASYIGVRLLYSLFARETLEANTPHQVPAFIFLILGYKIRKHGLKIQNWGPERSNDLRNTIQTNSDVRIGRLELLDDRLFTKENGRTFVKWVWVWLK